MINDDDNKHWLYRASSRSKLWVIQLIILLLVLLPEFFVHHHPHFEAQGVHTDTRFGFHAWYGFLTCTAMVVSAKVLGIFLKRKDTYYDD